MQLSRTRAKLDKNYGTIAEMTRVPAAIFVIDVMKEHIAVKEAKKLGIPTFAMVDTNSDPRGIDFVIPSNDDATKSIAKILDKVTEAINEGLEERKNSREKTKGEDGDEAPKKTGTRTKIKAKAVNEESSEN